MEDTKKTPEEMGEEDYTPDMISLVDEDGKEHVFELIDTLDRDDANGKECHYIAVIASPENPEEFLASDGSLLILKQMEEEDGETYLSQIEDEDEFDEVSDIFMDRLSDLYDFDTDEE